MMRMTLVALGLCAALSGCVHSPVSTPDIAPVEEVAGLEISEVSWYSEQVLVKGLLYRPVGAGTAPGVILAPDINLTRASVTAWAQRVASAGFVALAIDYRGSGASGGRVYLAQRVDVYDAMRFSEHDVRIAIRRGRHDPEAQVQDIRNAVTFLHSTPGVDSSRIAVMGEGLAGGHVVSVMGMDARVKVGVAVRPDLPGVGETPQAFDPDPATLETMIRLARDGAPPATQGEALARNALETRLLRAEYRPFWRLADIPEGAHLAFVVTPGGAKRAGPDAARQAAGMLGGRGVLVETDDKTAWPAAVRVLSETWDLGGGRSR